jgi:Na+-translocating ferredoxin:NAD+ oxidoreductase RnfG subunit
MTDHDASLFTIVPLAALAAWPTPVIATQYLSVDAAQRAVFPQADAFERVVPVLTSAQRQSMATLAGRQPAHGTLMVWRALRSGTAVGYVFIDEVVGRSELITYAVGIDANGILTPIEVLAYRESHGGEIKTAGWRRQFAGRHGLDQLDFRTDIKNIAGATLSAQHVTEGVRWIVALWQTALAPDRTP